jgi:ATP-dependent exoDNAse (exonuclease V) alpha subunit
MIKEFDRVVLNKNIPAHNLKKGDLGTVVMIYPGNKAYEVEFITLDGKTIAVETLDANYVLPVQAKSVAHSRILKSASRKRVLK